MEFYYCYEYRTGEMKIFIDMPQAWEWHHNNLDCWSQPERIQTLGLI